MIKFFKKYPKMILFLSLMILMGASYGIYLHWYNHKNEENQKLYDDLSQEAWTSISDDKATSGSKQLNNGSTDSTTSENNANEDNQIDEFLNGCGDKAFYEKYVISKPDLKQYRDINHDVVGYLSIPETIISYPILQDAEDNDYYLKHNIDGSKGYPGCIYIENYNHKDFEDSATVIYGHNMKNDTMFGTLDEYREPEYREKNKYIFIYTDNYIKIYEVVACSVYSSDHLLSHDFEMDENDHWSFNALSEDDQVQIYEKLKAFKANNSYFDGEGLTQDDKCIALATCSGENRYVVLGKLIYNITL